MNKWTYIGSPEAWEKYLAENPVTYGDRHVGEPDEYPFLVDYFYSSEGNLTGNFYFFVYYDDAHRLINFGREFDPRKCTYLIPNAGKPA